MNSPFMEMGAGGRGVTSTLGFRRVVTPLNPFGDAPSGGFPPANDPTNADSTPDYDNWGPDSWWTAQDWMTWHRSLKARFGLDEANSRFIIAWEKQGLFSAPLDARSFDVTFQNYAKANGFYDGLYYGLGALVKPIGAVTSVVSGASAGIATIGSLTQYILPLAAIALAYMAFTAYAPRRK
jgi:hypothetical protein